MIQLMEIDRKIRSRLLSSFLLRNLTYRHVCFSTTKHYYLFSQAKEIEFLQYFYIFKNNFNIFLVLPTSLGSSLSSFIFPISCLGLSTIYHCVVKREEDKERECF